MSFLQQLVEIVSTGVALGVYLRIIKSGMRREILQKKIDKLVDNYQCVTIKILPIQGKEKVTQQEFSGYLQELIQSEKEKQKNKAIWVHLHSSYFNLAKVAVEHQFQIHHAQSDYMLLYLWIKQDQQSNIPLYPRHLVGAAGFVVNQKQNKVLLVMENQGFRQGKWGLPAGHTDPNEILPDTIQREVQEELKLETRVVELFCYYQFEKGIWKDTESICFFFILELVDDQKDQPQIDEKELEKCKWIDIDQLEDFIQKNETTFTNVMARFPRYYKEITAKQLQSTFFETLQTQQFTQNSFYIL